MEYFSLKKNIFIYLKGKTPGHDQDGGECEVAVGVSEASLKKKWAMFRIEESVNKKKTWAMFRIEESVSLSLEYRRPPESALKGGAPGYGGRPTYMKSIPCSRYRESGLGFRPLNPKP